MFRIMQLGLELHIKWIRFAKLICICVNMYIYVMLKLSFAWEAADVQVVEELKCVKNYLKCVGK